MRIPQSPCILGALCDIGPDQCKGGDQAQRITIPVDNPSQSRLEVHR